MLVLRNLSSLILFLMLLTSFVEAQNNSDFVSPDNSFTIALPFNTPGIRVINPYPGVRGGNEFNWHTRQGQFLVGYVDYIALPKNTKQQLQKAGDVLIRNTTNYGGKLMSEKDLSLGHHPGLEIRVLLPENVIAITRFYLIGRRMYNLSTGWDARQDGAVQLKILDSFQLRQTKAKR